MSRTRKTFKSINPAAYLASDSAVNTTGTMPSADTLSGLSGQGVMRTPAYPFANYFRKGL